MTTPDAALAITPTLRKWTLHDPAPGGETYVFGIGPNRMTSPHRKKVLTTESTTARDGQMLTWEGAPRTANWQLAGTLIDPLQKAALERFLALNRRVWIIDHLGRAFVVTVETFEAVPQRSTNLPDLHFWEMTLQVHSKGTAPTLPPVTP